MSINDGNIVLGPGEGKMIPVPGHKITHKLRGEDTDGKFSLLEVELYGDGPPQHIHKTADESFYVLEGEIKVLIGERVIHAKAGSFINIPKGMVHAMCLAGEKPAKFIATYTPAGTEKFFDEAAGLDPTDTDSYVAKAKELADKYNMEIVGPPLDRGGAG